MRMLVVGAGATGGYFGGRLFEAGRDVTFLVRERRAAQLRERGLEILSPHGDATLRPSAVTAGEIAAPFDVVLLSVKSYALRAAMADMTAAIGPDTIVFPILNGMRHLEVLTERYGGQAVIGGVCKIASTLDGEGRVRQLAAFNETSYGEIGGGRSDRIARLDEFMRGAGFEAAASDAILQDMWDKWIMLASLGAATALMRGTVGEIEAVPGGAETALRIFDECIAVATASGYPPREIHRERTRAMLTAKGSGHTSSMYRDLQAGSQVEADHIVGDMLLRATGFGHSAPLLAAAYANLSVYGGRLKAAEQG